MIRLLRLWLLSVLLFEDKPLSVVSNTLAVDRITYCWWTYFGQTFVSDARALGVIVDSQVPAYD